jgi:flavin prenyltransferase
MVAVTEMGGIVCPPVPAFYLRPQTVQDIIDQAVARALDLLEVPHALSARWSGEVPA